VFYLIARGLADRRVLGRARLQPGRHDPHEHRALTPEEPTHAKGKTSAPEIESQRTARHREQAGVFPTVRMRPADKNRRPHLPQ
jgi:hypothetical protein